MNDKELIERIITMSDEELREIVEEHQHLTYAEIASTYDVTEYQVRRAIGLLQ